jgi:hypothetical protein
MSVTASLPVAAAAAGSAAPVPAKKTKAEMLRDTQVSRALHCRLEPAELLGNLEAGEILVIRTYDAGKSTFHVFGPDEAYKLPYFVTSRGDAVKQAWALSATACAAFEAIRD